MDKIGLAEAIEALRAELAVASTAAAAKGLKFRVDQATIEFEVVTERVADGSVGVKFWVAEVGVGGSISAGRTHRVSVALTPITSDGPLMTADDILPD